MANRTRDMTSGSPIRLLINFALPMMLGNLCQQLYTIVDTAIVGRFAGVGALAALGAGDWLIWLVLGVAMGFEQGFSIMISQRFGAGDMRGLRRCFAASIALSAAFAAALLLLSQIFLRSLLLLLDAPPEVLPLSELYLRILFAGIPVTVAYHLLAGILRALGDGRSPLVAMLIASLINIGLDLLFVVGFGWGVAGAAVATVIAQFFSMLYCARVVRGIAVLKIDRTDFSMEPKLLRALLRLGAPVAMQNTVIALGGMGVQVVINRYGVDFVAGCIACIKVYGMMDACGMSLGFAVSSYTGQNFGARDHARIRSGVRAGICLALGISCGCGILVCGLSGPLMRLFVSGTAAQVAAVTAVAREYLLILCLFLPLLFLLYVYRSALYGIGDSLTPLLSGFAELIMRVSVAWLLPLSIGRTGVYFAEVAAWAGSYILMMPVYYIKMKKLPAALPTGERRENP